MAGNADVAVVGGGIVGLAHAYHFARQGKRVVLFERNQHASGASVRNFGMVWPVGQPAGELHQLALASRSIWLEALTAAGLPYRPTGSLHVAHHPDEADVLREFAAIGPARGFQCQWLDRDQTLAKSAAVEPSGLIGSLWSEGETTVDPRQFIRQFPSYLQEALGVTLCYGTNVREIRLPRIVTTCGEWQAEQAIVCGGDDFLTLYPEVFATSGIIRCKLQMLRTVPQPDGWQLGPSLAAGLTLRFYKSFQICSTTLPQLKARVAAEKPDYERWAIHVLASQTADGAITLGDSHQYGPEVDIFDRLEVDELILREAATFLKLPSWQIEERWHGVYSLHPSLPWFEATPEPGVRIVTATGGSGMTLSFGIAARTAKQP